MVLTILFLVLSLAAGLSFIALLLLSGEFDEMIAPLDKKEFFFPEIYGVGFLLLKLFKAEYTSPAANKARENASILYGERYAEYYLRVLYAERISVVYFIFAVMSAFCCLAEGTDKIALLVIGLALCGALYWYLSDEPASKVKKRSVRLLNELPNAVSTVALLVNSGMVLRDAWREVSRSGEQEIYREMQKVSEEIDNGVSEPDALLHFAARSATPEIKRFTSFITQGLAKGPRDLTDALENQNRELWEAKKQNAIRQGDLASSRLIIPLMVMFGGILLMIMGPILTNLGL